MAEENNEYISLFEAAKLCPYSEPYLRLRARQGKLKSIKFGKKWMTTSVWVGDYTEKAKEWNEKIAAKKVMRASLENKEAPVAVESMVESMAEPVAAAPQVVQAATPPLPPSIEAQPRERAEGLTSENGMPHLDFVLASGIMFAALIFVGVALNKDAFYNNETAGGAVLKGQITENLSAGKINSEAATAKKTAPQVQFSSDPLRAAVLSAAQAINNFKFPWE